MNEQPFFWPPLEPDDMAEARQDAAVRIIQTRRLAWDTMLSRVCGLHEMPPRKRFTLYGTMALRAQEQGLTLVDVVMQLERLNGEEARWIANDIVRLTKQFAKTEAVYA